jgi:hypothetical protein
MLYTRMDDLARKLIIARADAIAHQDMLTRLSDTDLLIIDDFLTVGIDPDAASDLFAILANREHRLPTLIASQSGPDYWAQVLPDRVAADSIRQQTREQRADHQHRRHRHAPAATQTSPRRRRVLGIATPVPGQRPDRVLPGHRNAATNNLDHCYRQALSAKPPVIAIGADQCIKLCSLLFGHLHTKICPTRSIKKPEPLRDTRTGC